jgi:hypothetical protein
LVGKKELSGRRRGVRAGCDSWLAAHDPVDAPGDRSIAFTTQFCEILTDLMNSLKGSSVDERRPSLPWASAA